MYIITSIVKTINTTLTTRCSSKNENVHSSSGWLKQCFIPVAIIYYMVFLMLQNLNYVRTWLCVCNKYSILYSYVCSYIKLQYILWCLLVWKEYLFSAFLLATTDLHTVYQISAHRVLYNTQLTYSNWCVVHVYTHSFVSSFG